MIVTAQLEVGMTEDGEVVGMTEDGEVVGILVGVTVGIIVGAKELGESVGMMEDGNTVGTVVGGESVGITEDGEEVDIIVGAGELGESVGITEDRDTVGLIVEVGESVRMMEDVVAVNGAVTVAANVVVEGKVEGTAVGAAEDGLMNSRIDVPRPVASHVITFSFDPSTAVTTPAVPMGEISLLTDRVNDRVDGALLLRALNCSFERWNFTYTFLKIP